MKDNNSKIHSISPHLDTLKTIGKIKAYHSYETFSTIILITGGLIQIDEKDLKNCIFSEVVDVISYKLKARLEDALREYKIFMGFLD